MDLAVLMMAAATIAAASPAASPVASPDILDVGRIGPEKRVPAPGMQGGTEPPRPAAVSIVGLDALQQSGGSDIRGAGQLVPSLLVSSSGSEANASARIRGIGTVGDNVGLESSVPIFIDGVYRSRTGIALNDIAMFDRIEVLRGPQGSLVGRNATAGVINIVTPLPSQSWEGIVAGTYGNYGAVRLSGALTGPLVKDLLAFRLDGVLNRRRGVYQDVVNDVDYSERNRFYVRGQMLATPATNLSIRMIGDYSRRSEACCGAVYVDTAEKIDTTPAIPGDYAINPSGNRIVQIMQSMGAVFPSAGNPYNRQIALTPGRAYSNITRDYGGSAQANWTIAGVTLTSTTAYRGYRAGGAADIDYGNLDLGYRADDGNAYRRVNAFTQEARVAGKLLGGAVEWQVGGFYGREDVTLVDNLKFGTQYGAFAACRLIATINPTAVLRDATRPGCLSTTGRAVLSGQVPGSSPAFGAVTPTVLASLDRLSTISDVGDQRSRYDQEGRNLAFFTQEVVNFSDRLSLTGGLRYTRERKTFSARFQNDNSVCPLQQRALTPLFFNPALDALKPVLFGLVTLSCVGNSSVALNDLSPVDRRTDDHFTGDAVLSYRPAADWIAYARYARGYKAGGYNLDRSDLTAAAVTAPTNASASRLWFDPETVDGYEIGLKYGGRAVSLAVAAFRQVYSNFQVNAFNGSVFLVQNIGRCSDGVDGGDVDSDAATGQCTGRVGPGARSQGVEIEAEVHPARSLAVHAGYTLTDARYRRDLVGSRTGEPLDPALFLLPGHRISNAPQHVATAAISWTPALTAAGMTGLVHVDGRMNSDYNTGADLLSEKRQDGYLVVNARIGLRGPGRHWDLELWGQNVFNTKYQQVAFSAPYQGSNGKDVVSAFGGVGNAVFASFLAEPRTYGLTVRQRF